MRIGTVQYRFDLDFDARSIVVLRNRACNKWDVAAAASTGIVGIFYIVVLPLPFAFVLFCGGSVFV